MTPKTRKASASVSALAFALVASGCEGPVEPGPLHPPLAITAEALSPSAIRLTWQPPRKGRPDHYVIERALDLHGPWDRAGLVETTEFVDDDLDPRQEYWYHLRSCTSGGACGDVSTLASVETWPLKPEKLNGLTLKLVDGEHVWVYWRRWSAHDPQELQRRVGEGPWVTIAVVEDGQYRDYDITEGAFHAYRVRACNVTGCTDYSPPSAILIPVPGPSTFLLLEEYTLRDTWLWWDEGEDYTDYEYAVERSVEVGPWEEVTRTHRTWYGDMHLIEGARYRYRVSRCDTEGCGAPFGEVERTMPFVPPASGRLVVTGGYEIGLYANEYSLRIVDDVNDIGAARSIVTFWRQDDMSVVGTDLWIFASNRDLVRLDLITGAMSELMGYDELLARSGLSGIQSVRSPQGPTLMLAVRPGGGVLLSAADREDGSRGTAVFDASLSEVEAFVPFLPWTGVVRNVAGEETWFLLGTRAGASGEEIELMVVREGRIDEARYFGLGSYRSPPALGPAAAESAEAGGSAESESLAVDEDGVAWIAHDGTLHRIATTDGRHERLELPAPWAHRVALGPEYAYALQDGWLYDDFAKIYRTPRDGTGVLELFADAEDEKLYLRDGWFNDLVVGPEGRRVYALAGTNSVTPYWSQPLQLYVYDAATGGLVERTEVGGYGFGLLRAW